LDPKSQRETIDATQPPPPDVLAGFVCFGTARPGVGTSDSIAQNRHICWLQLPARDYRNQRRIHQPTRRQLLGFLLFESLVWRCGRCGWLPCREYRPGIRSYFVELPIWSTSAVTKRLSLHALWAISAWRWSCRRNDLYELTRTRAVSDWPQQ